MFGFWGLTINFPSAIGFNDPALTYFSEICGTKFSKGATFFLKIVN